MNRIVYTQHDIRGDAIRELVRRLCHVEKQPGHTEASNAPATLEALRKRGCINQTADGLFYNPSWQARQVVFGAPVTAAWTERIVKRQQKAFRPTVGAIFRFPLEGAAGPTPEVLEAFITDWSPFPAAAALAIHGSHPLAESERKGGGGSYFTGRFARHPLTGDLLPIWVASWVRPDFGTGAVVVNPAHSAVDLDFAGKVGLPVRFSLALGPVTPEPKTWPQPPVIKQGTTIKTGFHDGLTPDQAVAQYFEALAAHGWAESATDRTLGAFKIASVSGEPESLLSTLLDLDATAPFAMFWPASEIESSLTFFRLLWFDVYGEHLHPQSLHVWQRVDPPQMEVSNLPLAVLITGPLDQVGVIKQQVADQARTFIQGHQHLLTRPSEEKGQSQFSQAKRELMACNYHTAFNLLYGAQKHSIKNSQGMPAAYFAIAHVLAGTPCPEDFDLLAVWNAI